MTFKIYFEIEEEFELEDYLDREIIAIILADRADGVIDDLEERGYKVSLKKVDRNP